MQHQPTTILSDARESRLAKARELRRGLREPFRVDRRTAPRWKVDGQATLLGLGERMGVMAELDALEGGPWWLKGDAANPVDIGTRVSVGFSDPAARPANGEVIRCDLCQWGRYRIAVQFRDDIL
ncbi:MAG: hypothetical protein ACKO0W_10330 [Planctomycetota bacterium]